MLLNKVFWFLVPFIPTWHWFMPKATDYFWHIERLPQLFAYFANFSVEGVSGEAKQQQLLLKFTTQKSSYLLHFNADRKEIHGVGCLYFLLTKNGSEYGYFCYSFSLLIGKSMTCLTELYHVSIMISILIIFYNLPQCLMKIKSRSW